MIVQFEYIIQCNKTDRKLDLKYQHKFKLNTQYLVRAGWRQETTCVRLKTMLLNYLQSESPLKGK